MSARVIAGSAQYTKLGILQPLTQTPSGALRVDVVDPPNRVAAHSAVAANAIASATLAAAVGRFTYLTSLQIFATGATAAGAVNATITGLLGGTMTIPFAVPAGVDVGAVPINLSFATPLRGNALNTAIVVSLPALGAGNTRATVSAQGFQQ